MKITLNVNSKDYQLEINGNETLMEVLRNNLGMTGTKTACEESECGTCAINIDGRSILSCITLAAACKDKKILTIEGLADGETLHPLQQAFLDKGAVQCGFCIPGIIMSAKALLEKNLTPTREEIDYALDGNLCRCAGYLKIIEAVEEAGRMMASPSKKPGKKSSEKEEKVIV